MPARKVCPVAPAVQGPGRPSKCRAIQAVIEYGAVDHNPLSGLNCRRLYSRLIREDSRVHGLRCVHRRLLPEEPRGGQRAVESRAYFRRFQLCIVSSAMGKEAWSVADVWLRGSVGHLHVWGLWAHMVSDALFAFIIS